MGDFSDSWLALREPVDQAARSQEILAQLGVWCADRQLLTCVDLAAGNGSGLRAIAPALPVRHQRWTLVDLDIELLAAARRRLAAWADSSVPANDRLTLTRSGKTIDVRFQHSTLCADLDAIVEPGTDLVVASALFDLVSVDWIDTFVASLSARSLPLYAALTYDGREEWQPAHELDREVHAAFQQDQRRDKGFGPAAGSDAMSALLAAFSRARYQVTVRDSPWILTSASAGLIEQLADGTASAAAAVSPEMAREAGVWADTRRSAARSPATLVTIGHKDLWAIPPSK